MRAATVEGAGVWSAFALRRAGLMRPGG